MNDATFVLLAAGRGVRLGGGKLTADLAGQPVWRWAAAAAESAGFADRHVVTNDAAIAAAARAHGWQVTASPFADEGIAASIAVAATLGAEDARLVLALGDMPFIPPAHLIALAAAERTAFTGWPGGARGIPAGFAAADRARLLDLTGDRGAAALDWPGAVAIAVTDAGDLRDIDTPADLAAARTAALRR